MQPAPASPARRYLFAFALLALSPAFALAQPAIGNVAPRGLRIGATTVLTFSGGQLGPGVRLISNLPITSQQVLEGATAEQVKIAVSLPADLLPGIYAFRLVSPQGISDAQFLGVDRLAQSPFVERIEALPIALSGTIAGEQKLGAVFRGAKGEEISVDVESRRLGGTMKPVVRLLDASGKQIAYSAGREPLEGDARFTAVLPVDGEYRVELHDMVFRAPPSPFRLKVGRLLFADAIFPADLNADTEAELEFFALGKSWGVKSPYRAGAPHPLAVASWRPDGLTGVVAPLRVSGVRQFIEPAAHDAAATVDAGAAPVGVAGKLHAPQEIDRYAISVAAGTRYRFELRAARIGSPVDGQLIIRNEQGAELARDDDQPGTSDPGLEIDAPAGATKLIAEIRDTQGGGGDGFVYQLVASSLAQPAAALSVDVDRVAIPRGGLAVVPVKIGRRNFAGGLAFSLANAPAGIQIAAGDAPADSEIALVAFSAAPDAAGAGISRIAAKSSVAEIPLASQIFRPGDLGLAIRHQEELRRDFAFAAIDASPLGVTWERADVDLLGDQKAVRCQLKLDKRNGLAGKTRIRLLTSQIQPKKTVKENNQDKVVDDVEKTLRLEGETTFAADAGVATVILRVPADLPPKSWQVAFVAEVLGADDKAVIASAPCLPRTMKFAP